MICIAHRIKTFFLWVLSSESRQIKFHYPRLSRGIACCRFARHFAALGFDYSGNSHYQIRRRCQIYSIRCFLVQWKLFQFETKFCSCMILMWYSYAIWKNLRVTVTGVSPDQSSKRILYLQQLSVTLKQLLPRKIGCCSWGDKNSQSLSLERIMFH